jgi:hypothetical protein
MIPFAFAKAQGVVVTALNMEVAEVAVGPARASGP